MPHSFQRRIYVYVDSYHEALQRREGRGLTVEETVKPDTRYAQAAKAAVDEVAGQSVKFHWEASAFPRRLRYLLFR